MFFRKKKETGAPDFIIVGLGNPGAEYERTRHNAGFLAVDELADTLGANYWKSELGGLTARCNSGGSGERGSGVGRSESGECAERAERSEPKEILLAKPLTFMNLSGSFVKKLIAKYGANVDSLIVIHDDLDIEVDTLRFKDGGGHGGHNGIKSISAAIGQEYKRLKIGIGRPPGRMDAADFVLQRMNEETFTNLNISSKAAAGKILEYIQE
jgi:PTH1 family peptidyl-tRNA hydrolase